MCECVCVLHERYEVLQAISDGGAQMDASHRMCVSISESVQNKC